MKVHLLIIMLLNLTCIYAQDLKVPIVIEDVPDYVSYLVEDANQLIDGRKIGGINSSSYQDSYVQGDWLYMLHQESVSAGVYIDAVNIHSGERKWRNYIGWRTQGYGVNMDKIEPEEGELIKISGFRGRSNEGSGVPDVYLLNSETGEIIDNISLPEDEIGIQDIRFSSLYLNFIQDRYFKIGRSDNQLFSYSTDLYSNELVSNTIELDVPHPEVLTYAIRRFGIDGDRALFLTGYEPEVGYISYASIDRKAILFDSDLRYESSKVVDAELFPYAWNIRQIIEDLPHHQVLLCRDRFYPDKDAQRSALVFMNGKAEVTHTFDLGNTGELSVIASEIDADRFMVVTYSQLSEELNFYSGRYDSEALTLLSSHIATTDFKIGLKNVHLSEDKVVLVLNNSLAIWSLMLDDEDVGLISSTQDEDAPIISISPNPTHNYLEINHADESYIGRAYRMIDGSGKCVLSGKVDRTYKLPTGVLSSGHYVLHINGCSSVKFIKI